MSVDTSIGGESSLKGIGKERVRIEWKKRDGLDSTKTCRQTDLGQCTRDLESEILVKEEEIEVRKEPCKE